MTSRRVKVQGDLFHGRIPDGAVYIGRAAPGLPASKYANPFRVKVYGAEAAVAMYHQHLAAHPELVEAARQDLADCDAACWCPEPAAGEPDLCHGRPLLDAVAAPSSTRPAAGTKADTPASGRQARDQEAGQ